jgi:hypothetical protein
MGGTDGRTEVFSRASQLGYFLSLVKSRHIGQIPFSSGTVRSLLSVSSFIMPHFLLILFHSASTSVTLVVDPPSLPVAYPRLAL